MNSGSQPNDRQLFCQASPLSAYPQLIFVRRARREYP
jgi:hypothetical protein